MCGCDIYDIDVTETYMRMKLVRWLKLYLESVEKKGESEINKKKMGGDGGGVVGFVGLDLFSFELASSLLRSGFKVQAFEVSFFFFI